MYGPNILPPSFPLVSPDNSYYTVYKGGSIPKK